MLSQPIQDQVHVFSMFARRLGKSKDIVEIDDTEIIDVAV